MVRLAVAAVAIPAILWISYQGGGWLFGLVMLLAVVGGGEFLINEKFRPGGGLFWLALAAIVLLVATSTEFDSKNLTMFALLNEAAGSGPLMIFLGFFLISGMLLAIGRRPPAELFGRHSRLVWGVCYIGLLYPFVFKLGGGAATLSGGDCLLFLFALLWVGDTAAMAAGKNLGRHKLAPAVSPDKTAEGFIGGIVGALLAGLVLYWWKLETLGIGHVLAIATICSVFGQLGDLVESMWKRSLNIKDSSGIIPGHGGVLDRFDSLLFAAPAMYAYLHIVL